MQRDRLTQRDAQQRIDAQLSLDEKISRSDWIIQTDGSHEDTSEQVDETYNTIAHPSRVPDRYDDDGYPIPIGEEEIWYSTVNQNQTHSTFASATEEDKKHKRIPLRELFINIRLIKKAFGGKDGTSTNKGTKKRS